MRQGDKWRADFIRSLSPGRCARAARAMFACITLKVVWSMACATARDHAQELMNGGKGHRRQGVKETMTRKRRLSERRFSKTAQHTDEDRPTQEDAPPARACFKPDDLYTIMRARPVDEALQRTSAANKITITE